MEIPDTLGVETWSGAQLPADWAQSPAPSELQDLGKDWVMSGRTAVLCVPSAVIAHEVNVLINPAHHEAAHIRALAPKPFVFDPRLIKAPPTTAPTPRRKRKP
jgi:RES domain-containing protein